MTSQVFADTWYFLALLNADDVGHARARRANAESRQSLLTTGFVLIEVADALSDPQNRDVFLRLLEGIRASADIDVIPPDQSLFDAGVALFSRRSDKSWSLTDCISFVVMGEHGLTEALTADRHFEQAGFVALLKD